MKRVLRAGLLANSVAMLLLAGSHLLIGSRWPFAVLLLATGSVGTGFGLALTALNAYAIDLFPRRADTAVAMLHVLTGLGQVGAAVLLSLFLRVGAWWGAPVAVGFAVTALVVKQATLPLRLASEENQARGAPSLAAMAPQLAMPSLARVPLRLWLFAGAVFLYGASEATLGNWSPIYLQQDAGLTMAQAAAGLSMFWGAVTLGRVLFVAGSGRLPSRPIYATAPLVVTGAFLVLPSPGSAASAASVLAVAGLGLSIYFPLSISLASAEHPQNVTTVSGIMVAAVMLGAGAGANVVGLLRDGLGLALIFRLFAGVSLFMAAITLYLSRGLSLPAAILQRPLAETDRTSREASC